MTQITVLSGVQRRRHWSDERKLALVEAAIVPSASVATIAREADVSPSSIYRWRRELCSKLVQPTGFAAVAVHPQRQLARYAGILQADAYSGYDALYTAGRKPGHILEAACWAHARRPFFKEARLSRTPLAVDIVTRMDAIFAAERVIWGRNASKRLAARQVYVAPLVADLEQFLRQQYGRLSRKGDLAKAINYMLSRWASFARFVSDGRICMTNNATERRVRTVAVGRRNWTFCGSDLPPERRRPACLAPRRHRADLRPPADTTSRAIAVAMESSAAAPRSHRASRVASVAPN